MNNKKIFSQNLQYYMTINDKKRGDICKDLNIKYTTLREWILGTAYPRIDTIELLAEYFNINKSDLIENRNLLSSIDNSVELSKKICELSKTKTEEELLIKSTMLNIENQKKILEIVNMYLKEQGDYCIFKNGKWILEDRN